MVWACLTGKLVTLTQTQFAFAVTLPALVGIIIGYALRRK